MSILNSVISLAVLQSFGSYVRPQRSIGVIIANVTVEEVHEDTLTITRHPVERSAAISDHAFKEPATVRIRAGFSPSGSSSIPGPVGAAIAGVTSLINTFSPSQPSGMQSIYNQFLDYQKNATLLQVVTGKRTYQNMLIAALSVTTDEDTENVLLVYAVLQEVILVDAQVVSNVPSNDVMSAPEQTGSPLDLGPQSANANPSNYNAAGSP